MFGVPTPHQLSDRPAHRVADRDEPVDAERGSHIDGIVRAILEPERLLRSQPGAMPAVVERDHAVALAERAIAAEPVEIGSCCPTMEQHDRGRVGRGAEVAHHHGAAVGEFDESGRR